MQANFWGIYLVIRNFSLIIVLIFFSSSYKVAQSEIWITETRSRLCKNICILNWLKSCIGLFDQTFDSHDVF